MSARRLFEVFRLDLRFHLRRPLFWILVVLLAALSYLLSTGNAQISSGDSDIGGQKAWMTSQFAVARLFSVLVLLFYGFFVSVAAGMGVIRDDELRVGPILHSTPLSAVEYVWGKFLAVLATFLLVLALHTGFQAFSYHVLVSAKSAEFVGPFAASSYLTPALWFGVPTIVFFAGASFALGAALRRPILVFFLPVAALLFCGFFLWEWNPSWLDPRVDRWLMWVDPAGARWLHRTFLEVDRGVRFYNEQPIPFDAAFALSRFAFVLIGLVAVVAAQASVAAALRGRDRRAPRAKAAAAIHASRPPLAALVSGRAPLASQATARPPGFLAASLAIARIELKELRSQAGLYLFAPLILLQTIGTATFALGPFGSPLLLTSGTLAGSALNTLTLLITLLLLFYTVISLERERAVGLAELHAASPVRTAAVLAGKTLANSLVGVVVVIAAFVGCALVLAFQGRAPIELYPFALVWGGLLVPTLVLWCAFVVAVHALTRSAMATWGLGLAAWIVTLVLIARDDVNWVGNWPLWNVVSRTTPDGVLHSRWSDLGTFELLRRELWLNRAFALALAVLFLAVALRFHPRRASDPSGTLLRLRPRPLFLSTLRLAPWAVPALALGIYLWLTVRSGFQGEYARKEAKDYWAKNAATYTDAPVPAVTAVDLDVELEPERRWFRSRGTYVLLNDRETALRRIPVTTGFHWDRVSWTLDGVPVDPEDRAGLHVFRPQKPLEPKQSVVLGFDVEGRFPAGATRNGGGTMEFILPAGVVLTSFGTAFVPVIGYQESIGVDEDNHYDAREFEEDWWEGRTDSGLGNNAAMTTRIAVHAPEEYAIHSVGTQTADRVEGGVRTVVWESDHPVYFFNVIAGRWAVHRGEDTSIHYHPSHAWNVPEMGRALDGARRHYSEWFRPYPWKELKLSEFPNLETYAQGFPTNITFSEGIGFLTKSDPKTEVAFLVTAHEAAHQWWGNLIVPGKGPGANVLSEGASHWSTILLTDQILGLRRRIEFCKRIEERYGQYRVADSERPLVRIDNTRPGDTTATYDKGGWAFWMLTNEIGRERMLAGCRELFRRFEGTDDHPALEDFVATIRDFAPDPAAYDAFTRQWFFEVVVPKYELSAAERTRVAPTDGADAAWDVRVTVTNAGTATMPVEIAAERGTRFPDEAPKPAGDELHAAGPEQPGPEADFRDARATITLGPGESKEVLLRCDFEPERVLVDPDALVLQLERKAAIFRF